MNLQRHQAISDNEKKAVLPVWSFYAGISGTTLCMKNESPGRWSSEKSLSYAPSAFFSIQTIKCKKVLAFFFNMCYIIQAVSKALTVWMRGISAVGSAQHWQCWGQEFESPMLHLLRTLAEQGFSSFQTGHGVKLTGFCASFLQKSTLKYRQIRLI